MAEAEAQEPERKQERPNRWVIAGARLATGLIQGVGLYLLTEAAAQKAWPADTPMLYAGLLVVFSLAPLIVIGGLGRIRLLPLAVWTVVAAMALAAFAWHDIDAGIWSGVPDKTRLTPATQIFFFGAVFVFVGHHLVGPADAVRKLVAPYRIYFDWAWKDAVQITLSAAFVGVLWIALELGGALFALISIDALQKAIHERWFWIPVTCVAFAIAVQLTDVRIALIQGVRTVGLVLLSWLLPVMTVLVVAFLAALPLTGLAPLFGTRSGASTVLSASAALIVLVSAAYQDGVTEIPLPIRWAGRAAGLALVPLVLIAADALWLRVGQYGLSPARIEAIACAVVAAGFAAGYATAAVRRHGPWMRPLELTNVLMARVAMLAILVLFTPIADPARLAVGDQVGRLISGREPPEKFDFQFLTFQSGRYGAEALRALAARRGSPRDVQIAALAVKGQQAQQPFAILKPASLASRFSVFPSGAKLPPSFTAQDWEHDTNAPYQACFTNVVPNQCIAVLADVDGDGSPEVLVTQDSDQSADLDIYKQGPDGRWWDMGQLNVTCPDAVAALKAGQLKLEPKKGFDVELAGQRQQLTLSQSAPPCPITPPATNSP